MDLQNGVPEWISRMEFQNGITEKYIYKKKIPLLLVLVVEEF
jgi:hypothetical protein